MFYFYFISSLPNCLLKYFTNFFYGLMINHNWRWSKKLGTAEYPLSSPCPFKSVCPYSVQIATGRRLPNARSAGARLTARRIARRKTGRRIRSNACAPYPPSTRTPNNISLSCWSSRVNISSRVSIILNYLLSTYYVTALLYFHIYICDHYLSRYTCKAIVLIYRIRI